MRVLVCGGRNFRNVAFIWLKLDRIHAETPITALIHGGGGPKPRLGHPLIGADWIAGEWAKSKGLRPYVSRVTNDDWAKHGPAAGPIRNAHMLTWKPDVVIAFEGGTGTADMVAQARAAGVRVIEVA